MKEISIKLLLNNMTNENNYTDDIWKKCLNEKGKRYKIKEIISSLKKLETLGFIKKIKISKTETHYNKISYSDPEDYIGFINNLIFSNESKIKEALRGLENKKVFVYISKDLNSYKLNNRAKLEYENTLKLFSNMAELASSIHLVKELSKRDKIKDQLDACYSEIKETLEQTNEKIIRERKSNEVILLQRHLTGRIPNPGHLKL